MRNNIYAEYSEKFVKNVVVYAETDGSKLFFDEDHKKEVYAATLRSLFTKGLLILFDDTLYVPISIKEDKLDEEVEVTIYDGSDSYSFVAEFEEEEEDDEPVDTEEEPVDTDEEVIPTVPTFDDNTGVITIPEKEGVVYKIGDVVLEAGPQEPIATNVDVVVVAVPDEGYKFPLVVTDEWTFSWTQ